MGRDRAIPPHPARALTAALTAALLGCAGDTPFRSPGAGLRLTVQTYACSGGCGSLTGPVDTVHQGDMAVVRLALADTAGDSAIVLVRPPCAVNVTILGGAGQHTLPAAPSCPDSGVSVAVGPVAYLRDVLWIVDGTFGRGDYTLRADLVVDPPVTGRSLVRVQ